ncbi:DUF4397 domain-containing protein [Mucilaginibacter antarcticus]|uniref:DUF4397 domain-containing protein n=1 Tax=Mucilaginibacter antarcticus TaxID=1855725 RepID=UPI00363BCF2F
MRKRERDAEGRSANTFLNAVVGAPAHDVYIADKKVISSGLSYGVISPYIKYTSGINLMAFVDPSTNITSASENYGSDIGDQATLFLYANFQGRLTAGGIKDNMTAPAAGKARVRFINLHYNLTSAMIVSIQGGAQLFTELPFGSASAYFEVAPSTKFTTQATGVTTNPVIDLNIQAGKIYNVWFSGANSTEINGYGYTQN